MVQLLKFGSERTACAALGRCRQNVVATIKGIFFSLPGLLFSQKGMSWVVKLCMGSKVKKILSFQPPKK